MSMIQVLRRRGFILPLVVMLLPICFILLLTVGRSIINEKNFLAYERGTGRAYYMAETGMQAAFYSYSTSNFTEYTHDKRGITDPDAAGTPLTGGILQVPASITAGLAFTQAADGWYEWTWNPGDPHEPFANVGLPEAIRFRCSRTDAGWEIVGQAQLGQVVKTHRLAGVIEPAFNYALFDNADLGEFIRGPAQRVDGDVHANGNIMMTPWGGLEVYADYFASAKNIYAGKDLVGRELANGSNNIKIANASGTLVSMTKGFDSFNADWTDPTNGAAAKWNGIVKDGNIGAQIKIAPPVETFEPGGFYDLKAQEDGLKITASTSAPWAQSVSFYNGTERRVVEAIEIDMSILNGSDFPNNGLIYSEVPIVLKNAQQLEGPLSIVSQATIYTKGDVNKDLATRDDYDKKHGLRDYAPGGVKEAEHDPNWTTRQPMALMTKDRIFHSTKDYQYQPGSHSLPGSGTTSGNEPEEYPEDNEYVNTDSGKGNTNVIEINSALLDGAPNYDEVWNRVTDTGATDPDTGQSIFRERAWGEDPDSPGWNDFWNDPDADGATLGQTGRPGGPTGSDGKEATNWDDYMEHMGSIVVKKRGSIVHMQNASMDGIRRADGSLVMPGDPEYNNINNASSDPPPGVTAWYRNNFYSPPYRDYGYDKDAMQARNGFADIPYAPIITNRTMWKDN